MSDEQRVAQQLQILRGLGFLPFIGPGCYCRTPYLRLITGNQNAQTFRHVGYPRNADVGVLDPQNPILHGFESRYVTGEGRQAI